MECPFPGMDPFLEDPALWPDFQRQLIATLAYQLGLGLSQEHYRVVSKRREHPAGAEDFLEVRAVADGRLVTLVEVVSLANKTTALGRQAYLDTRREAKDRGANLVEIDLLLQGQPMLDYSRDGLPEWDYGVTVTRGTQPERYEIYTATVQKRLLRYRVPLSPDDRDTVLDLQADFTRSYAQGGFRDRIDYASEPNVPLREADRRWLDATLTAQGLRLPMPSQEQVVVAAYYLWEREGRPQGRDREHWARATAHLRRRTTMSELPTRSTFESLYSGQAPWDIGRPQKVFVDVADQITGSVLDAGCGTGENALYIAAEGRKVTGIDFLEEPIRRAKAKAAKRGLDVTFLVKDVLTLTDWLEKFDTVLDSGLFHVFSDADRSKYVAGLANVVKPGGKIFLACFSEEEPGMQGPRRVTQRELREAFAKGWHVESIRPVRFEVLPNLKDLQFSEGGPKAWFAVIRRQP